MSTLICVWHDLVQQSPLGSKTLMVVLTRPQHVHSINSYNRSDIFSPGTFPFTAIFIIVSNRWLSVYHHQSDSICLNQQRSSNARCHYLLWFVTPYFVTIKEHGWLWKLTSYLVTLGTWFVGTNSPFGNLGNIVCGN